MSRRNFPIFLLTAAFLLSAWGNVIAAAFCPRYSASDGFVSKEVEPEAEAESGSCHHDMPQMNDDANSAREDDPIPEVDGQNEVATLVRTPSEPCGHCWTHSQPTSGASTAAALSPSMQSVEDDAPLSTLAVQRPFHFPISITPFEHGPPGSQPARHLLINVFRI